MPSSNRRPAARRGRAFRRGLRPSVAALALCACAPFVVAATGGTRSAGTDASAGAGAPPDAGAACDGVLGHALRPLAGRDEAPLCERFAGRVLLIVNTASKCGFTPQFEALETLYGRYEAAGLSVLGFPSDDFRQELDDEAEVAAFCELNYGVTFPMFQKVHVTGAEATPLFADLASAADGAPTWNFNKYLVDRDGRVLGRYDSGVEPLGDELVADIEAAL